VNRRASATYGLREGVGADKFVLDRHQPVDSLMRDKQLKGAMYRSLEWCRAKLGEVFRKESDAKSVMHWIAAARKQKPVLFLGSGFSLNAKRKAVTKDITKHQDTLKSLTALENDTRIAVKYCE
jgi:hypothetical protein